MTEISSLLGLAAEVETLMAENEKLKHQLAEKSVANNRPKLSKREARYIRTAHRGGATQAALAYSYDVNPATISRIVRGDYYA